jgi:long-chain acyl-CoA synthetase
VEETLNLFFRQKATENADNVVYKYKEGKSGWKDMTYRELLEKVENFGLGLSVLGLKPKDHLAIIAENSPKWVITDMASATIGTVDIPLYPTLTAPQTQFILQNGDVRCVALQNKSQLNKIESIRAALPLLDTIIIFESFEGMDETKVVTFDKVIQLGQEFRATNKDEAARRLAPTLSPDDMVSIVYTSGTTKDPKGVMLSHRNLLANAKLTDYMCLGKNEITLNYLPLAHIYGRSGEYLGVMNIGGTIAFSEHHLTVPRNLEDIKPTRFVSVPALLERAYSKILGQVNSGPAARKTLFNFFLNMGKKHQESPCFFTSLFTQIGARLVFQKIRQKFGGRVIHIYVGGGATSKEVLEFFWAIGMPVFEGYGLTESSPLVALNQPSAYRIGSVGKAYPGMLLKIAEDGEILTKGPNVMLGYWKNEEATREAIDEDGYLHTGDVGHLDKDDFLYITDRKKEIHVLSSGKNVAPQPLENALKTSPFVAQAVTIGQKREYLTALLVPNFEALEAEAKSRGIAYKDRPELLAHPEIQKIYKKEIKRVLVDFAAFEQVRKFQLLTDEFSQLNDELTPTLKLKRRVIDEHYGKIIEAMYDNTANDDSL